MNETALSYESPTPLLRPSRVATADPNAVFARPECPVCGASTKRRTARSGPRAGLDFWGCANWPGCKGTINIAPSGPGPWSGPQVASEDGGPRLAAAASAAATGPATHAIAGSGTAAGPATQNAAGDRPAPLQAASQAAGRAAVLWAEAAAAVVQAIRPAAARVASRALDLTVDVLHPSQAPALAGGRDLAGASAQAEFERRRARHRLKMRIALPAVLGIAVLATLMTFLVLTTAGPLIAIVGTAIAGFAGLFAIAGLPADVLAWRSGAVGERRTADALDPLLAVGYVVLHDRLIPGLRANIDHIAIGPGGVFAIETKNLRGRLSIVGDKLFVGERTRTGVVDETLREALAVQVALSERLNALRVTVRPVLCVHGTMQLLLDNEVQGVHIVSGAQLARYLRRQPGLLDAETVQVLAAIADRRLLPALP